MGCFRKKPVVIEAIQLTPELKPADLYYFLGSFDKVTIGTIGQNYIIIHTLEGDMRVNEGDWIIRGVKGEFYPCRLDVFEATYEPVTGLAPPAADDNLKYLVEIAVEGNDGSLGRKVLILLREIRRLREGRGCLGAIVDRLPKTADGVPVTHGMVTWCDESPPFPHRWQLRCETGDNWENHKTPSGAIEHQYSTREAAQQAAKGKKT